MTPLVLVVLPMPAFVFAVTQPLSSHGSVLGITIVSGALAGMIYAVPSYHGRGFEALTRSLPKVATGATLGAISGGFGVIARAVSGWRQRKS